MWPIMRKARPKPSLGGSPGPGSASAAGGVAGSGAFEVEGLRAGLPAGVDLAESDSGADVAAPVGSAGRGWPAAGSSSTLSLSLRLN